MKITGIERDWISAPCDAVSQVGRQLMHPSRPALLTCDWLSESELEVTWEPQPTDQQREHSWYLYQQLMATVGLSTELGDEVDY